MGGGCLHYDWTNWSSTCEYVCAYISSLNSLNLSPARAERCARLAASRGRHGNVSRGSGSQSDLRLCARVFMCENARGKPSDVVLSVVGERERERGRGAVRQRGIRGARRGCCD